MQLDTPAEASGVGCSQGPDVNRRGTARKNPSTDAPAGGSTT